MRRLLSHLCCLVASVAAHAQADSTMLPYPRGYPGGFRRDEITLLTGYHQGRYGFVELGLGRSIYGAMHHPFGVSYHLGTEVRVDRPELWGVKVGAYGTGGFAMGAQLIRYMHGGDGMTVLRPEIGIGLFKGKMTYAYNVNFSPERLSGFNTHMISFSYAFRVRTLARAYPH